MNSLVLNTSSKPPMWLFLGTREITCPRGTPSINPLKIVKDEEESPPLSTTGCMSISGNLSIEILLRLYHRKQLTQDSYR